MITQDAIAAAAKQHIENGSLPNFCPSVQSHSFCAGATWMQEQDQWIKVRDQQPPRSTSAGFSVDLLFFAEDQTKCGHFIFGLNKFSDGTKCYDAEYWQPLPAGPKTTGK